MLQLQPQLADYQEQGFDVYLVAQEDPERLEGFLRERGITIPVLIDRRGEAGKSYRVQAIPYTIYIDRDGEVTGSKLGWTDRSLAEFQEVVDSLTR